MMWLKNTVTGINFDISDEKLIARCKASGDFEEIVEEVIPEIIPQSTESKPKSANKNKKAGGKNANNS